MTASARVHGNGVKTLAQIKALYAKGGGVVVGYRVPVLGPKRCVSEVGTLGLGVATI